MKNALFVCIGNSCRSQMAEGFARKYGTDVINAWSAGLAPAPIVQPQTKDVMLVKNIDISEQFPKSVHELELDAFDIIFNMSGLNLPAVVRGEVRNWSIPDPMTQSEKIYIEVRDLIEALVMQYILELRRAVQAAQRQLKPNARAVLETRKVLQRPVRRVEVPVSPTQSSERFRFGRVRKSHE